MAKLVGDALDYDKAFNETAFKAFDLLNIRYNLAAEENYVCYKIHDDYYLWVGYRGEFELINEDFKDYNEYRKKHKPPMKECSDEEEFEAVSLLTEIMAYSTQDIIVKGSGQYFVSCFSIEDDCCFVVGLQDSASDEMIV
ncbi:MAG TPA: hypothetical protein DCP36_14705 [Sporomusaceae bacterium]|nr:hypothetical protein [Sporomusaceae bacterium]